jgi:hypothetical protein
MVPIQGMGRGLFNEEPKGGGLSAEAIWRSLINTAIGSPAWQLDRRHSRLPKGSCEHLRLRSGNRLIAIGLPSKVGASRCLRRQIAVGDGVTLHQYPYAVQSPRGHPRTSSYSQRQSAKQLDLRTVGRTIFEKERRLPDLDDQPNVLRRQYQWGACTLPLSLSPRSRWRLLPSL